MLEADAIDIFWSGASSKQPFWDSFSSAIHSNYELNEVNKSEIYVIRLRFRNYFRIIPHNLKLQTCGRSSPSVVLVNKLSFLSTKKYSSSSQRQAIQAIWSKCDTFWTKQSQPFEVASSRKMCSGTCGWKGKVEGRANVSIWISVCSKQKTSHVINVVVCSGPLLNKCAVATQLEARKRILHYLASISS